MQTPNPRIDVRRSARRHRTVTAYRDGDTVVVLVPARLSVAEEERQVDALVTRLLAREARQRNRDGEEELLRRSHELGRRFLAPQLGTAPRAASVRWAANQQRRWGSCTPADATIRLSTRLQPMPHWVGDYVLLHELVHLVEPNHTTRFHALLATYPDAERARGYLQGYADASRQPPGPAGPEPGSDASVDNGAERGQEYLP